MVHPDDFEGTLNYFRGFMALGRQSEFETRIRRFDGVYRWFQVRNNPLRNPEGDIVRWYGLLTDIHDRKLAEEAVAARERDLKVTVDTIPALVWSARADGTADFFNRHYLDYVGEPLDQMMDWQWTSAVHPDDLARLGVVWQQARETKQSTVCEARLRGADGKYRWFIFRANPLRDEAGRAVKWYGINIDIEDRKRAEERLRQSEASLADAQRVSSVGSFTWLPDTDEVSLSEELYRIFEFDGDLPTTFQQCAAMIDPDDRTLFAEKVALARAGMSHEDVDIRLRMRDGRIKYLRTASRATRRADGRELVVVTIQDITQRRLAEDAVNELRTELAHVSRVSTLGAMTASIAHEVNQPLSGIVTNAGTCLRMLASDPPNIDGARETARRTIRDGNRASEIVARLRALFSKKSEAADEVDLNEAARDVIALCASELRRSRVELEADLAGDLPAVVGDRIQLQQVILNLLLNAADALSGIDEGPRRATVRTGQDQDGNVQLTVEDNGVGIDPDNLAALFDAFYTTKPHGMGVGLSVSRSIIEHHRGRIWASPNAGAGASFTFAIPPTGGPVPARGFAPDPAEPGSQHPGGKGR